MSMYVKNTSYESSQEEICVCVVCLGLFFSKSQMCDINFL